jgi:hypothetical protein
VNRQSHGRAFEHQGITIRYTGYERTFSCKYILLVYFNARH